MQCLAAQDIVDGQEIPGLALSRVSKRLHRTVASVLHRQASLHLSDNKGAYDVLVDHIGMAHSHARNVKVTISAEPSNPPGTSNIHLSRAIEIVCTHQMHISTIETHDMLKYVNLAHMPDAVRSLRKMLRIAKDTLSSLVLSDVPAVCELISEARLTNVSRLAFTLEHKENYALLANLLKSFRTIGTSTSLTCLEIFFGELPDELLKNPHELAALAGEGVLELKLSFASNGAHLIMGAKDCGSRKEVATMICSFENLSKLSLSGSCGYPQWIDEVARSCPQLASISVDAYFACHYEGFAGLDFERYIGPKLESFHLPDTVHMSLNGEQLLRIAQCCPNVRELNLALSQETLQKLPQLCEILRDSLTGLVLGRRTYASLLEGEGDSGACWADTITEAVKNTKNLERLAMPNGSICIRHVEEILDHCGERLREIEVRLEREVDEKEESNRSAPRSAVPTREVVKLVRTVMVKCPNISAECVMTLLQQCELDARLHGREEVLAMVRDATVGILLNRSNSRTGVGSWVQQAKEWQSLKKLISEKRKWHGKNLQRQSARLWHVQSF